LFFIEGQIKKPLNSVDGGLFLASMETENQFFSGVVLTIFRLNFTLVPRQLIYKFDREIPETILTVNGGWIYWIGN